MLQKQNSLHRLLIKAKGEYVPVSHLAYISKMPEKEVQDLCEAMTQRFVDVKGKCLKNGSRYEMHYHIEVKK